MAAGNFYSYLYSHAETVAFDEMAETVDLTSIDSINKAFASYVSDNPSPYDLGEALLEEKFYSSPHEGKKGDETFYRYDMEIPGVEENFIPEELKTYLEEFLEKIGAENGADDSAVVEVEATNNERGGVDVDVYIAISGRQISKDKKGK